MSCPTSVEIIKGRTVPLFMPMSVPKGTLTIASGTFSLYDNTTGLAVVSAQPITGFDPTAARVRVWYTLATAAVSPGWYSALFTVLVTPSDDGITRTELLEMLVEILPVPEAVVATYDPSTPAGMTRMLAGDTNTGKPIWSDQEIAAALNTSQSVPALAAALLLTGAASDSARMAIIASTMDQKTDLSKLPGELREQAQYLRGTAIVAPSVCAPEQIFRPDAFPGDPSGTMDWE